MTIEWLNSAPMRLFSLLLACALSLWVLIYPGAFAGGQARLSHGLLTLAMWGIAAGFVHGVGFVHRHALWRFLLGPMVALPLMLAFAAWLIALR